MRLDSFHLKYSLSFLFLSFLCGFLIIMIRKIRNSIGIQNFSHITNLFVFFAFFMVITSILLSAGHISGILVAGYFLKMCSTDVNSLSVLENEKDKVSLQSAFDDKLIISTLLGKFGMFPMLVVQNLFHIPMNLFLLWFWWKNNRIGKLVNKFIWLQR